MKAIWSSWKKLMLKVGDFQASLVFSILYFILITPAGLAASLTRDFLNLKSKPTWHKVKDTYSTIEKLKEQ